MTRIRETARLRAKERASKQILISIGAWGGPSLRWRYFHAAHPRASICTRRPMT